MLKTTQNEEEIRVALKRCPEEAITAAIAFNKSRDPELVPTIVMGIIERLVEPDVRPAVREGNDNARLREDYGIDSLLMVEIVMLIEETLSISIDNEELRSIQTVGDVKAYLDAKLKGKPLPSLNHFLPREQIIAEMPQQPPFLFLNEARVNENSAEGRYAISGDEVFLNGHFKDDPIFPASLMLEALGQLAVFYLRKSEHSDFKGIDREKILFVACDGVRCHRICRPGDLLEMRIELSKAHLPLARFSGSITVNGERVVKVEEITLSIIDPEHPDFAPCDL